MLAFTPPAWKKQSVQSLTNPTISVATLRARSKCASEIIPRLYLSDFSTVTTPEELARLRVTHVISVMEDAPNLKEVKGVPLKRLHVPVSDVASSDLSQWFEQTNAWIGEALQDERNVVLVHCLMGMSRSASIVAAYLIATRQLHAPDAITFIRVRRRIIRPNPGFVRQLEIYSQSFDRSLKAIPSTTTDTVSTIAKADNVTHEDEALIALKVRTSLASRIRRYMISSGMKKMQDQK